MDVETFSEDVIEVGEARIVDGNKVAGVGVMRGLGEPDDRFFLLASSTQLLPSSCFFSCCLLYKTVT